MKYTNIYRVDVRKLVIDLLPPFLKKKTLISFIVALLAPIEEIHFDFEKFRKQARYKVTHNGQVFSLQAVLNDRYDENLRRIRLIDATRFDPIYIYPDEDSKPVYLDNGDEIPYIYGDEIFEDIGNDFVISVPRDIKPSSAENTRVIEIQITAIVRYYALAGKKFKIKWTE